VRERPACQTLRSWYMSLDHLWAGWRAAYVSSVASGDDEVVATGDAVAPANETGIAGCVFCGIASSPEPDEERLVVWAGGLVIVILNAYPYASGHVMVMPRRHVRELEELSPDEAAELWKTLQVTVGAIKRAYQPDGLNIGVNLGRAGGAGIPGHLHVHAVPRWIGDTNFMTATASVRVLPESLQETWRRMRAAWL
jgi:ATP adenylyltransferase